MKDVTKLGLSLADFETDRRLGITPCGGWNYLSNSDLATAIEFMPHTGKFYSTSLCLEQFDGAVRKPLAFASSQGRLYKLDNISKNEANLSHSAIFPDMAIELQRLHYLAILTHKRLLGHLVWKKLRDTLGHVPTTQEWQESIKLFEFGRKSYLRATTSAPSEPIDSIHVEDWLILYAAFNAIFDGHNSIVITNDRTVIEQFVTLCVCMQRDYRAWTMCPHIMLIDLSWDDKDDMTGRRYGFKSLPIVLQIGEEQCEKMLPVHPWPIHLHCWLIERKDDGWGLIPMSFRAERPMHAAISFRGANGGRNTTSLGDHNIHFLSVPNQLVQSAQLMIGRDSITKMGEAAFPVRADLFSPLIEISTFDLTMVQDNSDPIEFPWHNFEEKLT